MGGSDGKVRVWDLETRAILKDLVESDAVWTVGLLKEGFTAVFSKNGEVVSQVSCLVWMDLRRIGASPTDTRGMQTWGVGA